MSKNVVMILLWTVGYFGSVALTYAYTAYYWNNSIVQNLMYSIVLIWLFGLLVVALTVLFSILTKTNTGVLACTGGVVFASYFLGMLPKLDKLMPTMLIDGNSLIYGTKECGDYTTAIFVAVAVIVVSLTLSIPMFNKKYI